MLVLHTNRRFRPTLLASIALGIALTLAPAGMARDLYVVSVGITNAKGTSKLTATAKDAQDIVRWARTQEKKGYFDRVIAHTYLDNRATKSAIISGLSTLRNQVKAADYVMFYESSHGGLNSSKEFYMTAYDGNLTFKEIAGALKGVKGTKIAIFDACHSGETVTSHYGAELTVFSASKADQLSRDGPAGGNSLFTKHFLAGLYGKADTNKSGFITFQEAANYSNARLNEANKGKATKDRQDMMWSVPTGTSTNLKFASAPK